VSDPEGKLVDPEARIRHTIESVEKWFRICPAIRLVICDGSNFDFAEILHMQFPDAAIECLAFRNNIEKVKIYGKGYGEGEIISYAIQHSTFLKEADYFAKCTAKLWVENFADCLPNWNGSFVCKGYFTNVFSFRKTKFDHVDTRFYLVTREFFQRNLAASHEMVGSLTGLSIEHCFRNVIVERQLQHILFDVPLTICGVGGGIGAYYKNSLKRRLKERLRIWLVRHNPVFNSLFA
jgi:hypothetical protein